MNKIKNFLKFLSESWQDYCKYEHNRYKNGFYVHEREEPKTPCPTYREIKDKIISDCQKQQQKKDFKGMPWDNPEEMWSEIEKQASCSKCNHEGFIRDYDGTWLKDCECCND